MRRARVHPDPAWDVVALEGGFVLYDGAELRLLKGTAAEVYAQVDGVSTDLEIAGRLACAHGDASVHDDVLQFLQRLAHRRTLRLTSAPPQVGYVRPPSTAYTRDGGFGLLVDLRTGRRRALPPQGVQVWDLVCELGYASAVVEALRQAHPAAGDLERDVQHLLNELVEAGLLVAVRPDDPE